MKLQKPVLNGVFVGIFTFAFAAITLSLMFARIGPPETPELVPVMKYFPFLFGAATGFYAGQFAHFVSKKRLKKG